MALEPAERERGGEPGRTEDGRLPGTEAGGEGDDPLGRHPGQLGEPAVTGDPEVVPVHDDLGASRDRGLLGGHHCPDQVDAGNERRDAGDAIAGPGDHPVLVVDGRPVDAHRDLAGRQVAEAEGPHARIDRVTPALHHEGRERRGRRTGRRGTGDHRGTVPSSWEPGRRPAGDRPGPEALPRPVAGGRPRGRRRRRPPARSAAAGCRSRATRCSGRRAARPTAAGRSSSGPDRECRRSTSHLPGAASVAVCTSTAGLRPRCRTAPSSTSTRRTSSSTASRWSRSPARPARCDSPPRTRRRE